MKFRLFFLLIFPLVLAAQEKNVVPLSLKHARTSIAAKDWISLDTGWKFKTGDNPGWASPAYNDLQWQPIHIFDHSVPPREIPENSIVWFRLHFIADSSLLEPLAMRIYQTGPSQVFLDGKLIYNLGTVSPNADSIRYFSPNYQNLPFPIVSGREQVLAVRFANYQQRYPLFFNAPDLAFESWITKFENAESDYLSLYIETFINRLNVAIGAAIALSVLFFSLFFFFRAARVHLYFGLSVFFLLVFLLALRVITVNQGSQFNLGLLINLASALFLMGMLVCIYSIFNHRKGWIFRILVSLGALLIPLQVFFPVNNANDLFMLAAIANMIGVISKHLRENKTAALILLTGFSIQLLYILINLFSSLGLIQIPGIFSLGPFALLTPSLSFAIYLGYSFGMISESLRKKLQEVEQLSDEKQQILATQNETLEKQVKERTAALNQSLSDLKSTQAQLIQSEKMASLGELTAGIAHEIQNPLNFVNNFAEVNAELAEELKVELASADFRNGNHQLATGIAGDIKDNSEKIKQHGKRAEAIVKGMLEHSRSSTGEKQLTDINALADECLRIAYESFKNKNPSFTVKLETDFDTEIGEISIIPSEIGKVLLNLYNNAFYAASLPSEGGFSDSDKREGPTVWVRTKKAGNKFLISVRDNGPGIPKNIIDKIFQPFFTTKPTGQGTGLGLSLSYDIVKAHEGQLNVNSVEGEYTEFIIVLPV